MCTGGACIGNVQRQQTLDTATPGFPNSNPCKFQREPLRCSNCQLNGVEIVSTGGSQMPTAADFRHDSTFSNGRTVNGSASSWNATTNALNCSTGPGCADGSYEVHLQNPNNHDCADFGSVTLRLTLN